MKMNSNDEQRRTLPFPVKNIVKSTVFILVYLFVSTALLDYLGYLDVNAFAGFKLIPKIFEPKFPYQCEQIQTHQIPSSQNLTWRIHSNRSQPQPSSCPSYFRWIHEDLRPWKETGITRDMVEKASQTAQFRLVIHRGKAYVKRYRKSIQTRDEFTLWGILQLLRWYPDRLPDLDLMFDADDRPVVRSDDFTGQQNNYPPPLFRYCSDDVSLDIVFPDWSFWGWAEVNINPWGASLEAIQEGNNITQWKDRVAYAYWRGNPYVASTRRDLLKCNVSEKEEWNTRLYVQDWDKEAKEGFKNSKLENQCTHRYKIYIEGWAWSVSEKYIMACDSMTLYVKPRFYDFYIRGMMPLQHYWPIRDDSKCTSLQFAVHWGNTHVDKAREIGEVGSRFIREEVNMKYVYDYMFHLLNEYAKLLKFKVKIPSDAEEITPESLGCAATERWRDFMAESMVMSPSEESPCVMVPPYDRLALKEVLERKANLTRQVELWEDQYFDDLGFDW
ncbi:uncharacterized protein LOC108815521 [Raphanus sativus]|uniref:Uncharacterized protein LOC108815521 n=1 Tax=Raphanus sativus TaxID=3726 RepID=A0A6J0K6J4_RAPSA|nr:uncharacterized protein LOC108815521 [Raphanus sativus]